MFVPSTAGGLHVALYDEAPAAARKATLSCTRLQLAEDGGARKAPDWIELLPAGDIVLARDGRSFRNDHTAVIAAFKANGMSIPLDWEHALDRLDSWSKPGDGRAAAWIDNLEERNGALHGHVEVWTASGRASVESLEFRYVSPVVFHDDNRKVVMLPRCSLVNNPALMLPALCSQEDVSMNPELLKLLAALGLSPSTLSDATVATAIETYNRGKVPAPTLETHVPRQQYDRVERDLVATKATLAEHELAAVKARVDGMLKEALSTGRMIPAERDFFAAMAAKPGGVEEVEKFLNSRPVVGGPALAATAKAMRGPASGDTFGLSVEERTACDKGGITYQAFADQKARQPA